MVFYFISGLNIDKGNNISNRKKNINKIYFFNRLCSELKFPKGIHTYPLISYDFYSNHACRKYILYNVLYLTSVFMNFCCTVHIKMLA